MQCRLHKKHLIASMSVYEQYAGPLVIDRQLVNKTSNFSEICDLLVIYFIQIYNKLWGLSQFVTSNFSAWKVNTDWQVGILQNLCEILVDQKCYLENGKIERNGRKFANTKVRRFNWPIVWKITKFCEKNQNGRLDQKCYLGNRKR